MTRFAKGGFPLALQGCVYVYTATKQKGKELSVTRQQEPCPASRDNPSVTTTQRPVAEKT